MINEHLLGYILETTTGCGLSSGAITNDLTVKVPSSGHKLEEYNRDRPMNSIRTTGSYVMPTTSIAVVDLNDCSREFAAT